MSLFRTFTYAAQRWLLRRRELTASGLPLGMRLRFRTPDDVGRRIYKYGAHEPHVLSWLLSEAGLREGGLVIDGGANLGWYSVLLHRLADGRGPILAFEPDPDNRALLETNLALNDCPDVRVEPLALSDREGEATLHRYRDLNLGRHSLRPQRRAAGTSVVPVTTLDQYLAAAGLDHEPVALLKLDVEGHEAEAVRGARAALDRTERLILEYSPMYLEAGEAREMLDSLAACGLTPFVFAGERWRPVKTRELLASRQQVDTVWQRADSPPPPDC